MEKLGLQLDPRGEHQNVRALGLRRPEGLEEAGRALLLGQGLPRDPMAHGEALGTARAGEVGWRPREGLEERLRRGIHIGRELDGQVRDRTRRVIGGDQGPQEPYKASRSHGCCVNQDIDLQIVPCCAGGQPS